MVVIRIASNERIELTPGIGDLTVTGECKASGDVRLVVLDLLLDKIALHAAGVDFLKELCCFGKRTIANTYACLRQLGRLAFELNRLEVFNRDRTAARGAFVDR